MAKYETISTKVPAGYREKGERLGVKTSEFLRKAYIDEVDRREVEEINKELERLHPVFSRISIEEVVASIREDRERR